MANFCTECGSAIDVNTGKCPKCNPPAEPVSAWIPEEQVAAQTATVIKKNKTKGNSVLRMILFSILLFVTSILAIVVFTARNIVKEDNIEKVVSDVDVEDVLDALDNPSFEDEAEVISEYMYEGSMTADEFERFLEKSNVMDVAAEKIAQYAEDIYTNDDDFTWNSQDMCEFLEDNYEKFLGIAGGDVRYDYLSSISSNLMDYDAMEELYPEEVKDENPGLFTVLRIMLSYVTFAIALALSIVLIVALVKNGSLKGLKCAGVVLTIQGGLLTLVALVALLVPDILGTITGNELIGLVGGKLISINLMIFAVVLAIGILLFKADKIVNKFKR